MAFDLVLHGGRVIDPSQGIDVITDVGFKDGRIAEIGERLSGPEVKDVSGLIVTPGLIDLHTHVYWGGTSLGVNPSSPGPRRMHDAGRCGQCGAGQLPRFLGVCDPTLVTSQNARLPQCVFRQHLWVRPAGHGRRERRSPLDGPFPNNPATAEGGVREVVIEARKRGILFDIGHGMGSFAFKTARTMLASGFAPDCISSDVHALCIDGPAFDLLTTMSKFLCLGIKLDDAVRAATVASAKAMRRDDLGTLRPGSLGDASILALERGAFDYVDVVGEPMTGEWRLSPRGIVLDGKPWNG